MKKITLLVFSLMTMALVSNAQIIDNGQFENWTDSMIGAYTYDSLIHWKTTDLISQQNGDNHPHSAQPTTDAFASPTAIILTSWSAAGGFIPGIPGAASNGNVYVNIAGMTITPIGGVPDNVRHASLMGYYKYAPGTGDSASIEVCLFKRNGANRDTVASGYFHPQLPIGTYTLFTINLTPNSTDTPDSSLIWLQSSPRSPLGSGKTGSVLQVDSLYYQGIIGVNEISPLVKSMITYPVPAANDLNVRVELVSPVNMNYSIESITGKTVLTGTMNGNEQKIDVSKLANGHYVVNVKDESGQKMISHKFTVAH